DKSPAADKPATGPLEVRFVRIELPGEGAFLHLAEVQAWAGEKNLAQAGAASQISTAYDGPASLAIDGNTSGDYFGAKSTSHTDTGNDPWWEVDLGAPHALSRIVLWNRTDNGLHERLKNFRVIALGDKREPLWIETVAASPNPKAEWILPAKLEDRTGATLGEIARYEGGAAAAPDAATAKRIAELEKQIAAIKGVTTPIMRELPADRRRKTNIQIRGNYQSLGAEVTRGVPASLPALPEGVEVDRLAVARWLVDRRHPLTARVVVNRYWEALFGAGIVETAEDFGSQGELPSHPELLDYLAVQLMEHGWDTKWLLREIVTSATYRQSSRLTPEILEKDPRNRLLAAAPRFRLSAEAIRDQALAAGGLLSEKMYGPSVRPLRPNLGLRSAFGGSTDWQPSAGEDRHRRGLYTFWRRTTPYPSFM
ncbi:MAG: DUF1553 domain-containing protein, partial [Planctomycetales bacterium]|nr:DUF1553 domain-containing protein [Planctomycetales bacterium]